MNHAIKAIAHEIKIRRVAYFYSAAERRSRGALWPSFAPALSHRWNESPTRRLRSQRRRFRQVYEISVEGHRYPEALEKLTDR